MDLPPARRWVNTLGAAFCFPVRRSDLSPAQEVPARPPPAPRALMGSQRPESQMYAGPTGSARAMLGFTPFSSLLPGGSRTHSQEEEEAGPALQPQCYNPACPENQGAFPEFAPRHIHRQNPTCPERRR